MSNKKAFTVYMRDPMTGQVWSYGTDANGVEDAYNCAKQFLPEYYPYGIKESCEIQKNTAIMGMV